MQGLGISGSSKRRFSCGCGRVGSVLLAGMLTMISVSTAAPRRFSIEADRDTRFLPYRATTVASWDLGARPGVGPNMVVMEPASDSEHPGRLAIVLNTLFGHDHPTQINIASVLAPLTLEADMGLQMIVNKATAYHDRLTDSPALALLCLKNDTLYLVKLVDDRLSAPLFIATGADRSGDGTWSGEGGIVLIDDYDYDGRLEAILATGAQADRGPRYLCSVELDDMRIEWKIPFASGMSGPAFACGDSSSPGILLLSASPANGERDSLFDDYFCYLVRVSDRGEVVLKKILGRFADSRFLLRLDAPDEFYAVHTRDFSHDTLGGGTEYEQGYRLTRLTATGEILESKRLSFTPSAACTADFDGDGSLDLYLLGDDGSVRIFDADLQLAAESRPSKLQLFQEVLRGWTRHPEVLVCSTPQGSRLMTPQFKMLAAIGSGGVQVARVDPADGSLWLAITTADQAQLSALERSSVLTYASIIYVDYQPYILSLLFGLVVGLVTVNHYRRRTRSNLTVIAEQKDELEETHAALEAAHAALKEAQQRIIAQEKYQQARDIAGGFAHEIRNALFPARAAVERVRSKAADDTVAGGLKNIDTAVSRAINITRLITEYTRVENEHRPEKVDLAEVIRRAVDDNKARSDAAGVQIRVDAPPSPPVMANLDQIVIVMNNLIRNSLDALESTVNPRIEISLRTVGDEVEVEIQDNGPGVPESDRERIFDMFYSTRPRTGTGVGLALSRKLVSLYDGSLTCEPSDIGARFVLRLPVDVGEY